MKNKLQNVNQNFVKKGQKPKVAKLTKNVLNIGKYVIKNERQSKILYVKILGTNQNQTTQQQNYFKKEKEILKLRTMERFRPTEETNESLFDL